MKRLIVLRPEPGAAATCKAARDLGLDPLSVPLFRIEPASWEPPEPTGFDALLLTSANAVRLAGGGLGTLRALKAYAVGEATAAAAREAGLDIAGTGGAGVERLLGSLQAELRLLHLCGEHRKEHQNPRQRITSLPVYRSAELAKVDGLERIESAVVLVHSPRAGIRLAELATEMGVDKRSAAIAAISAEAAGAAGEGWKAVEAASQPRDPALLALASRLCNNPA